MNITDINFEAKQLPVESSLLVKHRQEILQILRMLMDKKYLINVMCTDNEHILIAEISKIDEKVNKTTFKVISNQLENKIIDEKGFIVCTARMRGVVIEFFAEQVDTRAFLESNIFSMIIPKMIIKLEHRHYHRVQIRKLITCCLPVASGNVIVATPINISMTGIAIVVPPTSKQFIKEGQQFHHCTLNLDEQNKIEFSLSIARIWNGILENGTELFIAGCIFLNLKSTDDAKLYRYIQKIELETMTKAL